MTTEEYLAFLRSQESPGGDIFSLAGRPRAPVPPPAKAKRKVMLPNGDYVSVGPEVSDEEALSRAQAKYPEIFEEAVSPEEDSGPIDAFMSTLDRTVTGFVPGVRAAFAAATGDEETYDEQQQKIIEARESATARAPGLRRVGDVGEAYDEDGFLSAAGVGTEFGVEQIGSSLGGQAPVMAAGLAGGALGTLVAGPIGATVGFWAGRTLAGIGRYMSEDLERGYAEGLANTEDVNLGKTLVAATGQSLLDNLGFFVLGGAAKIGRKPVEGAARSAVGKLYDKIGDASPLKRFMGTMVEEEVAELGQQALERWQAGLEVSPENEEAAAEYTEIFLATLFPSVGFAGMTEVGSKIAAKRALLTDAETEEHYKGYVKIQEALRKSEERLAAEEIEAQAERRDVGEDFRDRRGSFWLGRMQELSEGLRTQYERIIFNDEKVRVKDVTQIADDRNIIWDNDPAFMAFSKRVGKNLHLDSMNDEQLLLMYKRISAMPRQESKSHLAYASAEEATELGAKLNKGKGNVTLAGVRSKLGLNGAGINDDVADSIANGHIEKMVDMGLVEVSTTSSGKNKYKLIGSRLPMGVSEADYKKIIQESTDSKDGRFPSFQEAVKKYGIESKRAYKKLRAAALARRDIETRGDRDYISEEPRDLKTYQLSVNGNVEATRYSSLEEAQEARASIYSQGTAEEGAAKVSVTAARPMGVVKVVETPARAIPEAAEGYQYSVSHKDGSRGRTAWIVRKMAEEGSTKGDFVKSFPSKRKADEYVANADSNTMAFDVMVDGVRKGRAGSRRDAGILKEDIKRSAYATRYDSIVDSLGKTTNHGSQTLHRLAKQQATSYANAYGKSLKIESVGVESGLAAPSKEVGFSLSEAVTEGSKRSRMKEIDFFDYTEGLAKLDALRESGQVTPAMYEKTKEVLIGKAENAATGERDLIVSDRTGRESLKGRLRKGERPEAADVQAAEAIPAPTMADLSSQAKAVPAPEQTTQQQELVQASSRKIGSVLRSLGLGDVRVNITEALEDTTGGHANFDPVAQVINIAYTSGLKSIEAEADLTQALLPLVRHETVHIFRKLGVIKPTEWKSLTRFASKRNIPAARLESLNASLIEAGNSPLAEGATYLDYAHSANARSGSRASQLDELSARLEAGEISREEHAALVEKENSLKFIEDDYTEEAVAQAFQDVASGDLTLAGAPRNAIQKISKFVGGVYRSFTGQGYRSADEVFESLYGGNFKARIDNSRTLDPWYARRAGETVELKEDLTRAREDLLVSMNKRREVLRSRGKTEEEITDLLGEEFQGVSASGVEAGLETAARRRASRVDSEDGPDRKRHSSARAEASAGRVFKDSIVRDSDGELQLLTHATFDDLTPPGGIESFRPWSHFGTQEAALERLQARRAAKPAVPKGEPATAERPVRVPLRAPVEGGQYYNVYLNIKNPLKLDDVGSWEQPERVVNGIVRILGEQHEIVKSANFLKVKQKMIARDPLNPLEHKDIQKVLEEFGYDGIVYRNIHEAQGSTSYIIFRPEQVKMASPTPRPDRKRHSSTPALRDGSEELKASTPAVDPYTVGEIENQPFNAAVPPASFEVIPPPAISQSETVASTVGETSWFGIPYNRTGAKSKSGMPVVVLEGYHEEESTAQDGTRIPERGFGAAHLDRHNRDIADFTPYTTWSELLTDFGRELRLFNDLESSPTTARRGNIVPYPDQGATSYIWDDPSFTKPVLVRTMDIQRKDIDGVEADVAYVVSAYPTDNFSATVGGRRNITGHLHGENASLDSVKTYLDPASPLRTGEGTPPMDMMVGPVARSTPLRTLVFLKARARA